MSDRKKQTENLLVNDIVKVREKKVSCDGGTDFGHPLVYLNLGTKGEITCPYCSKKYILKRH